MHKLKIGSGWVHYVSVGRYTTRMLRASSLESQAERLKTATLAVRDQGRAWEDVSWSIQDATADRDANDVGLDEQARSAHRQLGARSNDAKKQAPFTLIFPDGLLEYTRAPVGEELSRYRQLRERLLANLSAEDTLLKSVIPALDAGLTAYEQAEKALEDARNAEQRSRDQLEALFESWEAEREKLYGEVMAQGGKELAERIFQG